MAKLTNGEHSKWSSKKAFFLSVMMDLQLMGKRNIVTENDLCGSICISQTIKTTSLDPGLTLMQLLYCSVPT